MAREEADKQALLSALGHPLRRAILRAMSDEEDVSPSELARRLGEQLTNLSYHVRSLAELGAIELVEEKRSRGGTKHFYRKAVKAEWVDAVLGNGEENPPTEGS